LKLEATPECYNTQIGQGDTIYAYGDSILWQRIEHDLRTYTGPNAEDYRLRFLEGARVVPNIFEWLLVSPDSSTRWVTTPLSYNLSPRVVPDEYQQTTHWFVADYSQGGAWHLVGNRYNAFTLKITPAA